MDSNRSLQPPGWWHYSSDVWQQLVSAFKSFDLFDIDELYQKQNWAPVKGGVTNFNYKLALSDQQFFVQVLDSDKLQRLPTQQFVASHQVMCRNTDLSRWLVRCLYESQTLRIFEWVDAKNCSIDILHQKYFENDLCQFLSVLHNNISILPILDIQKHLAFYYLSAVTKKPAQKEQFKEKYQRALNCAKSFIPSKNCHNDLSPGNVLCSDSSGEKRLIVVDWEYACISDPFFDLAGICVNFGYNSAQEEALIQNYSEKLSIYPNWKKFNEMKELYILVSELWSV